MQQLIIVFGELFVAVNLNAGFGFEIATERRRCGFVFFGIGYGGILTRSHLRESIPRLVVIYGFAGREIPTCL